MTILSLLVGLMFLFVVIALSTLIIFLVVRSRNKQNSIKEVSVEETEVKRTLGEKIKEHRIRCNMTQEYVAEMVGVSRQAVSKWETGASEPSTTNLIALAKLFGISVEELLQGIG